MISSSAVQNTFKDSGESGEISKHKRQDQKQTLNARDHWLIRWHCVKKLASLCFHVCFGTLQKTFVSLNSLWLHLQMQGQTLPCMAKAIDQHYPETPPASVGLSSCETDWCKVCFGMTGPHFKLSVVPFWPKRKRTIRIVISVQFKSQHLERYKVC